jgi:hypothetical protein
MKQKVHVYKLWDAVQKHAEEKNISYSAALMQLLPAYSSRFYKLDPPRKYPEELIKKADEYKAKYG